MATTRTEISAAPDDTEGANTDDLEGFTQRVLVSAVFDISQLAENVERIKIQIFTLARERGIETPES